MTFLVLKAGAVAAGAVAAACVVLYVLLFVGRRGRNFPSGPPTLPLIGNLHQLPKEKLFLQMGRATWRHVYDQTWTIGPGTAVVITDRRIAKQLLDKRSAVSSDRPASEVSQQIITKGDHLLWMNNTPGWKFMRTLIHQDFTESMCTREHGKVQHAEAVQMLHDMMDAPDTWKRHLSRFSNSVILSIVYGIRSPTIEAPYVRKIEELLEIWARINAFGATPPIDIFPFLKLVPQKLFANWIDRAMKVHDDMHTLYDSLWEHVITRRKNSGSVNSVIDRLLDQQEKQGLTQHQITLLSGVTLKGGSDTSASLLASFVQAMVTWPEVQKKWQAEIDAPIPENRIPDISDFKKLPYVAATVKEAHRWWPVAPLSVPHALSEDEWIDGYFLPKKTLIFLNVWGLHHDERRYEDHDAFDPDRFKDQTGLAAEYANAADPEKRDHFGYGNGRRLCPGIHLADRNLFHVISKILWAFNIEPAVDSKTGRSILPDTSVVTGYRERLTACANEFPIKLTIRSKARRKAINDAYADAQDNVFKNYEGMDLF